MTTISGEIRIRAPKEAVWSQLADLGAVQDFNPGVDKSFYTSETLQGVGASRHCDLKRFGSVEERIVEWKDGESLKLEIYEANRTPPFRHAHGTLSVEGDGEESIARMRLDYELKFGPIGKLMDRMMVRSQFQKTVHLTLTGLKRHLESATT
jgi:carbon monoxide dehydrogenase subunit G